jgi:hypothetical protein
MTIAEPELIWSAVYGRPACSMKQGYGSSLTMEFGEPDLQIREPLVTSPGASSQSRENLSRRRVTVTGQWHLWIYCCNWSIAEYDCELAGSESSTEVIARGTRRLDGQKLLSVERGAMRGSWIFEFDLGGKVRTWPYADEPSLEQWLLYERKSGRVLEVRGDDQWQCAPGGQKVGNDDWKPM